MFESGRYRCRLVAHEPVPQFHATTAVSAITLAGTDDRGEPWPAGIMHRTICTDSASRLSSHNLLDRPADGINPSIAGAAAQRFLRALAVERYERIGESLGPAIHQLRYKCNL